MPDEQTPQTGTAESSTPKDMESMVAEYGMMAFEGILTAIKTAEQSKAATAMVVAAIPALAGSCALTEAEHASVKSGAKKAHVIFAEKLAESVLAFDMARVEASKLMVAQAEAATPESAPTP